MPAPRRPRRSLRETFGLASQAEMYLGRALEEFHRSANPPDLWVPVDAWHRGSVLEGAQAAMTATNRRLHFLRSTILFAALSAEAFANELLDDLLPSADADALDKLRTPEKLLFGTRLAGADVLDRGAPPLQNLVTLFGTRNRLVHPRPRGGLAAWVRDVEAAEEAALGPAAARDAILCVVDTVVVCNPLRKHPRLHGGLARTIDKHRQLLDRHQALAGSAIIDVPPNDAPDVPDLLHQMQETAARNRTKPKPPAESD